MEVGEKICGHFATKESIRILSDTKSRLKYIANSRHCSRSGNKRVRPRVFSSQNSNWKKNKKKIFANKVESIIAKKGFFKVLICIECGLLLAPTIWSAARKNEISRVLHSEKSSIREV